MKRKFLIIFTLFIFLVLSLLLLFLPKIMNNFSSQTRVSLSLSPTPTPEKQEGIATAEKIPVTLFMVALEDGGKSGDKIGCNDSLIGVTRVIPKKQSILKETLTELFSLKEQFYGESGLYNSLSQSDLKVEEIAISNGTATINLQGKLVLGGSCDNPRVIAQISKTAKQFPTVGKVNIYLNKKPLEEILSGK